MEGEFADLLERLPSFDLTDVPALRKLLASRLPREPATRPGLQIRQVQVPGRDRSPVPVRLYLPSGRRIPSPAIVYCHGGGFVMGGLDTDHERCVRLADEAGVVVVSPDYRLSPEHRYPAGLDDCTAVLGWLHENAPDMQVDRCRVAVGGTSAGGALAAGVALRAHDESSSPLALLLLACPVTDSSLTGSSVQQFWDCAGWNGAATEQMWQNYLPRDGSPATYAAPALSPSTGGLPPTEIVIADLDPLRDEGLAFARMLDRARVSVTVHHYFGVPHGFDALLPGAATSARSISTQVDRLARLAAQS